MIFTGKHETCVLSSSVKLTPGRVPVWGLFVIARSPMLMQGRGLNKINNAQQSLQDWVVFNQCINLDFLGHCEKSGFPKAVRL